MNKYHCNWLDKGIGISHRGISYCCTNKIKNPISKNVINDFWFGIERKSTIAENNNNQAVKGCESCYIEESKQTSSDRIFAKEFDALDIKKYPRMMLVDFSNFCNLKCVMCSPSRSSQWAKETSNIKNGIFTVPIDLLNEAVSISKNLDTLIMQGGEPTMMEENIYFLEQLNRKNYSKNINIRLTTNGTNLYAPFYDLLKNFKTIRIQVSIDSHGTANDYIRWPSKFEHIERNMISLSQYSDNFTVEIHNTINILSMFNFKDFLFWCKKIEKVYHKKNKTLKIVHSKVLEPIVYSPYYASEILKKYFIQDVLNFFSNDNLKDNRFFKTEMQVFLKSIKNFIPNLKTIENNRKHLLEKIYHLDNERSIKITDYIPTFYDYF
jgi:organic radical activating enzyme